MQANSVGTIPPSSEAAHTQSYALRHDELDPAGYFPPSVLLGVLQEAAIDGSAARGFPMSYYLQHQAFWMLRRITFRYDRPLRHGEACIVSTWVSRVGKTSPTREYRIVSPSRGDCVARARTYWVYMDAATGHSKLIPDELRRGFAPTDESLEPVLSVPSSAFDASAPGRSVTRTAARFDVDRGNHVKCCRYVAWLEDLIGLENPAHAGSLASFDLQLFAATQVGEQLRLVTQRGPAKFGSTWTADLSTGPGQTVARAVLWPRQLNAAKTAFLPARPAPATTTVQTDQGPDLCSQT